MEDLDYLFSTARIKAMEGRLLSERKRQELINTDSADEVSRIMEGCGWKKLDFSNYEAMGATIEEARKEALNEISAFAPDKKMVDVFRLKYDYHNIKTLLKARSLEKPSQDILSDCGTIGKERMTAIINDENYKALSPAMRNAVVEANELLGRTRDYLLCDIALDRACFSEMLQLAKKSTSKFLEDYVKLQIDSVNLRTAVRINKRGMPYEYLRSSAIAGGSVDMNKLYTELTAEVLVGAYERSPLLEAAKFGAKVLRDEERVNALDKACDNVLMEYLKGAKSIGLGEQPLVSYIAALESELTALRVIFSGKLSGLAPDEIRERLREAYV